MQKEYLIYYTIICTGLIKFIIELIDQLCLIRSDPDFAEIICFVVLGGGGEFGGGGE